MNTNATKELVPCLHCGADTLDNEQSESFCCAGCERVYSLLKDYNLEYFYKLRNSSEWETPEPPKEELPLFHYLDDPTFREEYVNEGERADLVCFILDGIHCTACVWLLEQLPKLNEMIVEATVEFSTSKLTVLYLKEAKLSEIAKAISELGYHPRPLTEDAYEESFQRETTQLLYRLGVAAVSAGNCMMIAISLYQGSYSGIEFKYENFFIWVSAFLALPSVLYSAMPFFRSAWSGLKVGYLHVDLPLSIGIALGYVLSITAAIQGSSDVYFDSITILIFLMLGGRLLQRSALHRASDLKGSLKNFLPPAVKRERNGAIEEIYSGSVKADDIILVDSEERIPTDGTLLSNQATLDMSILSGESEPVLFSEGDHISAGALNLHEPLKLHAKCSVKQSRIVKLFDSAEQLSQKRGNTSRVKLLDLVSSYFVITVLILGAVGGLYWWVQTDIHQALLVLLSFFVVTCPCALGLSAPLILAKALSDSSRYGILITDSSVFERFFGAKNICLDKTGTITEKTKNEALIWEFKDDLWQTISELPDAYKKQLYTLENELQHPIAFSLRRIFPAKTIQLEQRIVTQNGIHGHLKENSKTTSIGIGNLNFIKSIFPDYYQSCESFKECSSPLFFVSGNSLYLIGIGEQLKSDAKALIETLHQQKKHITLLSGDTNLATEAVATELRVDHWLGEQSPELKKEFVESSDETIMVGDGGNDAPALSAASIGIGISGGMEHVLQVASVYISSGHLRDLIRLSLASREVMSYLRNSFSFAVCYNLLAGAAALMGLISPLIAAIIMPISSLTVIVYALKSDAYRKEK